MDVSRFENRSSINNETDNESELNACRISTTRKEERHTVSRDAAGTRNSTSTATSPNTRNETQYRGATMSSEGRGILSLSFNHDFTMFVCCTENGLMVYNTDPLVLKVKLDSSQVGSVGTAEQLMRSNLLTFIAGGSKPRFAENAIVMWDEERKKFALDITLCSPALGIRTRKDRIITIEKNVVHVFKFPNDPKKIMTFETGNNESGLCVVSPYPTSERQVLACPGHTIGSLLIFDLNANESGVASSPPISIKAHHSELACISINNQGTMIATASRKGTLIRVFDTVKQTKIIELRRGVDPATVYCMNFSPDSDFLCASSDKGTVHIFALKDTHLNRRSRFSNMGIPNTYVNSQWALATFTVQAECACICAFGPKNSVYAICVDGTYHKYVFNQDGNCTRDSFDIYIDITENDEVDNFFRRF